MKFQFSAGGVVYRKDPELKFLLIRAKNFDGDDLWQLPKGTIEKGEKPEDAAIREIQEETGANVVIDKKIEEAEYFYKREHELFKKRVYYFLMHYLDGEIRPQPPENEEVKWFTPDEAEKIIGYKNGPYLIRKAKEALE